MPDITCWSCGKPSDDLQWAPGLMMHQRICVSCAGVQRTASADKIVGLAITFEQLREHVDSEAKRLGVEPLGEKYVRPVVVWGNEGRVYDATELGQRMIESMTRDGGIQSTGDTDAVG